MAIAKVLQHPQLFTEETLQVKTAIEDHRFCT